MKNLRLLQDMDIACPGSNVLLVYVLHAPPDCDFLLHNMNRIACRLSIFY